ncbi:MAG: TonB-dependent hemoglobin/transferrin/lactoferrin family receptor [Pseudomonadota bacterium]
MGHCCRAGVASLLCTTILSSTFAFADDGFLLDQVTITSTKTETLVIDALSGSSVVSKDYLERFQPDDVSEIFLGTPGVETQSDGNDPGTAINIRGLQDFGRVNVLIEGARQDFQRSGHGADGIFYLDPELIKKVDITRGPVSTIFGSGAIGGVVNFELVDADDVLEADETLGAKQKVSYDTNDIGVLTSTLVAAKPDENVDLLGNFVFRRDDDFSDGFGRELEDTGERLLNGLFKGRFRPAPGHQITTIAGYQDGEYETGDTDFAAGLLRETRTRSTNLVGKYDFDSRDTPLINLKTNFYFTETDTEQLQLEDSPSTPAGNLRSFNVQTLGFDIFNTSDFDTGPLSHQFTVGIDAFRDLVDTNDPLGTGDEFTPSGRRAVLGGFIQNEFTYSTWLEVIGAVRFDTFDLDAGETELTGSEVSPKITVGITPFKGFQVFGTYAEGFRAPAVTEVFNNGLHDPAFPFVFLPNFDLEPETASNFEFGANIKYDNILSDDDRFRAKVTYFNNTVENFIEGDVRGTDPFTCFVLPTIPQFPPFGPPIPTFLPPSGCGEFQFVNIAEAEIRGIEVEASFEIGRYFSTLAYSRIRGDDTILDQPLESIRPDKFSATMGARYFDDALMLGGRVTHVQQQDRIPLLASDGSPNTLAGLPGDAFTLIDLFASYEPNERVRFNVVLNNITDQQYTRYLDVNASEGFSASLTASVKIGG